MDKPSAMQQLMIIPGVGKSIASDLYEIGIYGVNDLKNKDPEALYGLSNHSKGVVQDRCLLYVFRCAVYYVSTPPPHDKEKLKWWNWKNQS